MKKLLSLSLTALMMLFALPTEVRAQNTFTFTPEPGEVEAGTKIDIGWSGSTWDIIKYKWFADKAAADADETQELNATGWTEYVKQNVSSTPVFTAANPVIKVIAFNDDEEFLSDSVVVYTLKAAAPANTFTFNPEPGEVEAGTTITVDYTTEERIFIYYKWFEDKAAADESEWDIDDMSWSTYFEKTTGITATKPVLKVVVTDFDDEFLADSVVVYTVKAATPKVAKPTFNPAAGEVTSGTEVTISCDTEDAEIYYTTAAGEFSADSWTKGTTYTVSAACTLRAIAVKEGMTNSDIATATYTIWQLSAPEADKAEGPYAENTEITIKKGSADKIFVTRKGGEFAESVKDTTIILKAGADTLCVKAEKGTDVSAIDTLVYFGVTGLFTVTPNTDEVAEEDALITIALTTNYEDYEGANVGISYKWFASVAEAEADAAFQSYTEGSLGYNAEDKPVLKKDAPVLAVGMTDINLDEVRWLVAPVYYTYVFEGGNEPVDPELTVTAAGTNTMTADTVVFDGPAAFTMAVGQISEGDSLKIAAVLYTKIALDTFGQPITTDWYEATDTKAEFIGTYNGEYAVRFELQRYSLMLRDFDVIKDTTIYFNVTNYPEPAPEKYEITAKPVGVAEGENVVFTEENVAFDVFVKGLKADDEMEINVKIQTKAQADAFDTLAVETKTVEAADSVRISAKLANGEYVAFFELTRKGDRENATVESVEVPFTVNVKVAIERSELAGVKVYPNPTEGDFNMVVPERARIDIFGLNGAKVMGREVNAGVETFSLDHSGIYFVRVMAGNKTAVKRVVVR